MGCLEPLKNSESQQHLLRDQAVQHLKDQVTTMLLELPGVTRGTRFGGEAFFYRKKFFCHYHPAHGSFLLETFVWKNVNAVLGKIPGAISHPEYGAYGWVRLPISSASEIVQAKRLVEMTYRYIRTTKRISVDKDQFSDELLGQVKAKFPQVRFSSKESKRRIQVIMETPELTDFDKADVLLNQAARSLRTGKSK